MKIKAIKSVMCVFVCAVLVFMSACSENTEEQTTLPLTTSTTAAPTTTSTTATEPETETETETTTSAVDAKITSVTATSGIKTLESGIKLALFSGDDALSAFLLGGGAESDDDLIGFLVGRALGGKSGLKFNFGSFGCSTLSAPGKNGEHYFGRNFDWNRCNALILVNHPTKGFRSVSTVNTDFITSGIDFELTDEMLKFAALYCPLDGMNEKGVCISVNMIGSSSTINQNNGKPDITTTTAIRLVLDRASSAKEAVELIRGYDMHASFGYMVHFAICDSSGYSVAVEYLNNKMIVTETPVLTNFYVAQSVFGKGTQSSVERYNILMDKLKENEKFSLNGMISAMKSVGKKNFNDTAYNSTEWTAIFDQTNKTVVYCHRENYKSGWKIAL